MTPKDKLPTFGDLSPGDMFNTMVARYVKINYIDAIVVMSAIREIGAIIEFKEDHQIIPLYREGDSNGR